MKKISNPSARWQQRYAQLQQSLARLGYISEGSVLDRTTLKPPRTGYQWTRKVRQKTVTVALSAEQFAAMKKAVQNRRRLAKTIREMEALSRQILFATTADTQRFKPFKAKDLRLI
jgi:hypothetical protein